MKCPKCGCETPWLLYGGCPFCVVGPKKKRLKCGHEEKVGVRVVATGNTGAYDEFGLPVVGGEKP